MNGENGRPGAPDDRFPPYRQARFDEVPPPHVDRAILQEAERAAGRRRWPRPAHLAWAAAVVLSVALVLEIGVRPPATPERARMLSEPATDLDDAARRVTPARASREAAEQDGSARRETLDRAAPDQAAPALERFAAPVPGAARGSSRAAEAASDGALPPAVAPATRCSDEIRADAAAWLDCIAELRRAGEESAADAELEALRRRYPAALESGNDAAR